MSIFDAPVRRARSRKTPAHTLYNYWLTVLEGMHGRFISEQEGRAPAGYGLNFGRGGRHYLHATSSDSRGRPILNMAGLELRANGEFRIPYMRGWKRRNELEMHSFLGYTYYKSRPQWFVDLDLSGTKGYWSARLDLSDWTVPHHYVDERLFAKNNYYFVSPWLNLTSGALGWEISYSRPHETLEAFTKRAHNPAAVTHQTSTQETFDWYARLREKRRRGEERELAYRNGTLLRGEKNILTPEEREADRADVMQLIVANMTTAMPARTTPLRKTVKEEGLWPELLGTR